MAKDYNVGDFVVFKKSKRGVNPGPRARGVMPSDHGDDYSYVVDKFWRVIDVLEDSSVLCATPGGKQHLIPANSLNLRPARWWERWLYSDRFAKLPEPADVTQRVSQNETTATPAG